MYIYQKEFSTGEVLLSKSSFLHVKARRLKRGADVMLFNGEGKVGQGVLTHIDRNNAVGCIKGIKHIQPKKKPRLVIGVTKLTTVEFILQKATEIGVSEIILLTSEFTPIAFDQTVFDQKKERFEKIIIAACEQSETIHQPRISWMSFSDYMVTSTQKCMFDPRGELSDLKKDADLMIGPEGGWSDQEITQAPLVKLDTGVLRTDTASIAALLYWHLIGEE